MSGSDDLGLVRSDPAAPSRHKVPVRTARVLKVLFVLCVAIHVVAVWADARQLGVMMRAQDDAPVPEAEARTTELTHKSVQLIRVALTLPTWIVLVIWTYRANASLRHLGIEDMTYSPRWVVLWYLIPIYNLWKPYYTMGEIWTASEHPTDTWRDELASPLVGLWWTFWLISAISGNVAWTLLRRAGGLDDLVNAFYVMLCADAIEIPYYVIAFALVGAVTAMQVKRIPRETVSS